VEHVHGEDQGREVARRGPITVVGSRTAKPACPLAGGLFVTIPARKPRSGTRWWTPARKGLPASAEGTRASRCGALPRGLFVTGSASAVHSHAPASAPYGAIISPCTCTQAPPVPSLTVIAEPSRSRSSTCLAPTRMGTYTRRGRGRSQAVAGMTRRRTDSNRERERERASRLRVWGTHAPFTFTFATAWLSPQETRRPARQDDGSRAPGDA
jgi:hypothetical protein